MAKVSRGWQISKRRCVVCNVWIECRGRGRRKLDAHMHAEHPVEYARAVAIRRQMEYGE